MDLDFLLIFILVLDNLILINSLVVILIMIQLK